MVVKMRYNELKVNKHNASIISGVPRDWNRGIHSVNKIPIPNFPLCTYCH
jgi:hypothetical protein